METANLMPNRYVSKQNGVKAHLFEFDNDIRRLNKFAHIEFKQNLCHDTSFGKQIMNSFWHYGSSIDSYLK
jgi:hypothetical protein